MLNIYVCFMIETKFNRFLYEQNEKTDELYHFTSIFNAIGIVADNYMTSFYGYISTTRNKNLNKLEPPNVCLGVRFVLDWNKILEEYETKAYIYSNELDYEEEEKIITTKLENIKKYIKSIDIIIDDIQTPDNIGIHDDREEELFKLIDPEIEDTNHYDLGYYVNCKPFKYKGVRQCYKWSGKLIQKSKDYFESKGYKINVIN